MHVAQRKLVPGGDAQQGAAGYPAAKVDGMSQTIKTPKHSVGIIFLPS